MRNVLVTGGAGFIGSNYIDYLLKVESGVKVINIDALTYSGNLENLDHLAGNKAYTFIQGNICDHDLVNSLFQQYQIDTVVHFAAESHVDRSIANPEIFLETNVMGTYTLLEAARKSWVEGSRNSAVTKRFHHVSTDEVFGSLGPDDPPFNETTNYQPSSPYSASKAASDHLVRAYSHTFGLPISITNCSNNYGPFQYPEKLIPLIIMNAVNGEKLPIYGDGMNIRDWLFVEDHCQAIIQVIKHGREGETFIIGGNNQPTNLEVVETICKLLDRRLTKSAHVPHRSLIDFVKDRPGHDFRYAMDISKIERELNWTPKFTFEEGLEKTVDWYLSNQIWVDSVRAKGGFIEWIGKNYETRGDAE